MREPISILLVDDHAMLRTLLAHRLDEETDMRVVASVSNADEAVAQVIRLKPRIVLMDIDMPGMTCFEAIKTIQICCPDSRVIFLSAFFHDRYIEQALAVRAWGYIVKSESEEAVVAAVRGVASGVSYYSPEVQARFAIEGGAAKLTRPGASRASTLTDREIEVLRYLVRGMSRKDIAQTMHLSAHTVHRHTVSVMTKLDIHDRVQLTRYAIREGLADG